ncbi:MAG: LysR family transcriptional regulator ArgP [Pseudomonadota bacterium]
MDFDYDSLVVLAAVVRTGSFEAAAKSLNVTQSAVSQRIKQLEERVGSLLIVRGRPCVATEDGLLLCEHMEQISLLQHELRQRLSAEGHSGNATATIRICVNNDSLATWFPNVVLRSADEINLRLEVIADDQEFSEERLRSGDALAVVTTNDKPVAGCQQIALGEMEYMAIASPEYAQRFLSEGITLQSVSLSPALSFDRKDTLPFQWMLTAFGAAEEPSYHLIPSYEGHLSCCLKGVGWALMPTVTVGPLVQQGRLIELVPGKRVTVSLHWQARSQTSEISRRLSEIVAEEAAKHLTSA